jgi:hypothetical protein
MNNHLRHLIVLDGTIIHVSGSALKAEAEAEFKRVSDICIGTNSRVELVTAVGNFRVGDTL